MSEKTEKPTPHRLRQLRKEGFIVHSAEVTATAGYAGVLLFLLIAGAFGLGLLRKALVHAFEFAQTAPPAGVGGWLPKLEELSWDLLSFIVPMFVASAFAAVLAGVAQVGGVFTMKPLTPNLTRLNPSAGIRKLFSSRRLLEIPKVTLKVAVLSAGAAAIWMNALPNATRSAFASPDNIIITGGHMLLILLGMSFLVFSVSAMIDYLHQQFEFLKEHRMSKDDIKREYKELEGDPLVKVQRLQLARAAAFSPQVNRNLGLSAVVVNPTHFAVELYYRRGETDLPIVVDKGVDDGAAKIRHRARKNGIPIIENRALARRLHSEVPLDEYIPSDLTDAVAVIFKWVSEVKKLKG